MPDVGSYQPSDCAVCGERCESDIAKLSFIRFSEYLCRSHYRQRKTVQGLPIGQVELDGVALVGTTVQGQLDKLRTNFQSRRIPDMRAPSLLADAARKYEHGEITEDDYVTLLQELMVEDPQQRAERVELFTTLRLFLEGLSANYFFPDNVRDQAAFLLSRLPKAE